MEPTDSELEPREGLYGWLLKPRRQARAHRPLDDTELWVGMHDIWSGLRTWPIWMRVARQDIGLRYKRSLIGPFWISLSLAAMVVGMALLYSQIFHTEFKGYLTHLAVSLLCWNYISVVINESCGVLADEGLLRALPVSITGLSGRMMMRNAIIFFHNLLTVVVMLLLFQAPFHLTALNAVWGIAVYAAFAVILGTILGPICLRFRDLAQVIANIVQIVFFLTPIVWQADQIGGRVAFVTMNPIYHLLEVVRAPILGQAVHSETWIFIGVMLTVGLCLSLITLSMTRRRVYMWM